MAVGIRRVAVALLGTWALVACSDSGGVDREELEQTVKEKLAEEVGQTPKSIDCPEELKAELDASIRCTLTAEDGSEIGLTVTVTGVDGGDVNFDIQVDDS